MSYEDFANDIQRSPEEVHRLCTKHGFMILPFEPNDADIGAIACSFPITGGRKFHAQKAYESLVARRRSHQEKPDTPVKAPIIRQD